jgi:hypothetical protein
MLAGKCIIYFDETSSFKWDWQRNVWQPRDDKIKFQQNPDRGHSITVMGAICNKMPRLVYDLFEKTNAENVGCFFKSLELEF